MLVEGFGMEMLRIPGVTKATGYPRASIYQHIYDGTFVPPVSMGKRTAAFPKHEVDAIVRARIAGVNESEIKLLVQRLIADRQSNITH